MARLLVVCWVFAGLGVVWLRLNRNGRLSMTTARGDVAAALVAGTFLWLVVVIAI